MVDPDALMNTQDAALNSWKSFEESIGTTPRIVINPEVYLGYVVSPDPLEGHSQETLDKSIETAVQIYREAFQLEFSQLQVPVSVGQYSYVVPAAYGKGGPIGAPAEVINLILDQAIWVQLGWTVATDLLAAAVWKAGRKFLRFLREVKYPNPEQNLPSHDPFLIQAACEAHAREQYKNLRLGEADIHSAWPPSADLPYNGNLYTVAIPYRNGSIIYVISDRLLLMEHIRVNSKGSTPLDRSTWLSKFE